MEIDIILENTGGELDRTRIQANDEDDLSEKVHEALVPWIFSVGDTVRIVEVTE